MNKKVYESAIKFLSRERILTSAREEGDLPFGWVLEFLRDEYNLPKPDGWTTARAICDHFNL